MKKRNVMKLTTVLMLLLLTTVFTACGGNDAADDKATETTAPQAEEKTDAQEVTANMTITGAENVAVDELSEFDPLSGVSATGTDGADFTADIAVEGVVNTLKAGDYELTYSVGDSTVTRTVTVNPVEATPANGTYNYKFATAELRNTFMAAGEDYLLHNQFAGVPLFANAQFNLYSNRMQLVTQESLPVLEFATEYGSLAVDDSKVIMEDGNPGKEGEYTLRLAFTENPSQWNHWLSDNSVTSDFMEYFKGWPYRYELNDDKTGYALVASMADGDPIPVDSEILPNGKEVANKWQIKIKEGLEWNYNANTDTSMITDHTIDANDFYNTYKLALEQKWFRAISGGGDFVTGKPIVGAEDFVDGKVAWEDVGIKLIDDNTFELEFIDQQSQWAVKYFLGETTMSPIHTELYEALGDDYGTNEQTIAYAGTYVVDYYESDKIVRMSRNDKYHDADKHNYTHVAITVIADTEIRFQEFVAGKLDATALPSTHYEEYKSHPGLKRLPGATTFRMMINGTGSVEGQVAQFPESTWVPEPILANQDFKMGLYHAIDRQKLAEEVMKTSETQMYLFTNAYVVEAETGIPFRATEQGMSVGADLSPSTHGYNLDAARAYFDLALDTLVADGTYKSGDVIKYEFYFFSGSETQELLADYLKDAMEEAFNSEKHNIKVEVETVAKDFPGIYYDHMMIGEFDTSAGGISGSTLDAASFLDTFSSDNRSGFSLNWGVDTSVAEIEVSYVNDLGEAVKELWSFDALQAVLNGATEVVDGMEAKEEAPAAE